MAIIKRDPHFTTKQQKEIYILETSVNEKIRTFFSECSGGTTSINLKKFPDLKVREEILRRIRNAGWEAELYDDRDQDVDCIRFGTSL